MFAYTVYVLYDVCFILVIVGFKSSVELVFVYVYHAPTLNTAFCICICSPHHGDMTSWGVKISTVNAFNKYMHFHVVSIEYE